MEKNKIKLIIILKKTSMLSNLYDLSYPYLYNYFLGIHYSFLQLFTVPCPVLCSFLLCKITSISNASSSCPHPSRLCPNPTPPHIADTPTCHRVFFFLSSCDRYHLSLINSPYITVCIQLSLYFIIWDPLKKLILLMISI